MLFSSKLALKVETVFSSFSKKSLAYCLMLEETQIHPNKKQKLQQHSKHRKKNHNPNQINKVV